MAAATIAWPAGGGEDEIDGGAGTDTVVFDGPSTDYTVTRSESGVVTVRSGDDVVRMVNVEHVEFGDKTVDPGEIPLDHPQGTITIDARGAAGIDLTTYLASYFAGVETNGTSSFHGGTEDAPYGYLNGDQVGFKYRAAGDTAGPFVKVALLEGEEIAYDAIHYPAGGHPHGSISGTVDKLVFAAIDGAEPESGPDPYTTYLAELTISGLGLHDDPGAGGSSSSNPVPTLYYGVRAGNVSDIEAILAEYAQHFLGSTGGDTYVGGRFDDIAEGDRGRDIFFGEDGNDTLYGNRGRDDLAGDFGDDHARGGRGKDTLSGGSGNDTLGGGKGKDRLTGDGDDDLLRGGRGKDKLRGGDDDDLLVGGKAKDHLRGDGGSDTFLFKSVKHSTSKASGRDVIHGFERADGDRIDVSKLGDLDFIGKKGFSGDGNEVRFQKKDAATLVLADIDGNGKADFAVKIDTSITLQAGDFVL